MGKKEKKKKRNEIQQLKVEKKNRRR